MTIYYKCENQEFNYKGKMPYQTYLCKTKDYCPYQFEEHDKNGKPTGKSYCIERHFIKDEKEKEY